ncbi:MAG: hypothetical protein FVQ82_03245 [Planctomycetes bacterium]|nr:hypothetical protein [Planctomycetota bacterium]
MAGWKFVFVCLVFGVFFCFDFPVLAGEGGGIETATSKKSDDSAGHLEKLEVYMKQLGDIQQVLAKRVVPLIFL